MKYRIKYCIYNINLYNLKSIHKFRIYLSNIRFSYFDTQDIVIFIFKNITDVDRQIETGLGLPLTHSEPTRNKISQK